MKSVTLREITQNDVEYLWQLYTDASSMRYFGRALAQDKSELEAVISRNLGWTKEKSGTRYVAFDGEKFIGIISIKRYDLRYHRAEIDYIVASEMRQQGYGTAVLQEFLRKVFAQWDLARLTAYVNPENLASQHLLEKNGFTCETLLRNWDGVGENRYSYSFTVEDLK